VQKLIRT